MREPLVWRVRGGIALEELNVRWVIADVHWYVGYVEAVDLGIGEAVSDEVGHDSGATAYVEHLGILNVGWNGTVDDVVVHNSLKVSGLFFKAYVLHFVVWEDVCCIFVGVVSGSVGDVGICLALLLCCCHIVKAAQLSARFLSGLRLIFDVNVFRNCCGEL